MPDPKPIKQILEEMQAAGKLPPGTISVNKNGTAGCISQIHRDEDMPVCPLNKQLEICRRRYSNVKD